MKKEKSKYEVMSDKLKSVADKFTHQERMKWAIKNELHLETVNRYMRGQVSSLPLAEMLFEHIQELLKAEKKAA